MKAAATIVALLLLAVIAASSVWTLTTVRQQSCKLDKLRLSGTLGGGTPGRVIIPGQEHIGGAHITLAPIAVSEC